MAPPPYDPPHLAPTPCDPPHVAHPMWHPPHVVHPMWHPDVPSHTARPTVCVHTTAHSLKRSRTLHYLLLLLFSSSPVARKCATCTVAQGCSQPGQYSCTVDNAANPRDASTVVGLRSMQPHGPTRWWVGAFTLVGVSPARARPDESASTHPFSAGHPLSSRPAIQ